MLIAAITLWSEIISLSLFGKFNTMILEFGITCSEIDHSLFYEDDLYVGQKGRNHRPLLLGKSSTTIYKLLKKQKKIDHSLSEGVGSTLPFSKPRKLATDPDLVAALGEYPKLRASGG